MPTDHEKAEPAAEVRVLYFSGCPHHRPTVERLRAVADRLGVPLNLHEVEVTPEDDPEVLGFRGSPTVLINGTDVDPAVRDSGGFGFGCRTYGGSGTPSEAMLETALKEAISGDAGQSLESGPSAGAPAFWAPAAAVGTAGLASVCCWLPLLAVGLGLSLSVGGLIGAFEAARPYLLAVAVISLAIGFYAVYFRKLRCAPGSACATARSRPGAGARAVVWGAAAAVVALALFPYYSGALLGSVSGLTSGPEAAVGSGGAAPSGSDMVYEVEGMSCAGCEAVLCNVLREVPGVEACGASHERGRAWISVAAEQPEEAAVLEAIERAGFSGSPAVPSPQGNGDPTP